MCKTRQLPADCILLDNFALLENPKMLKLEKTPFFTDVTNLRFCNSTEMQVKKGSDAQNRRKSFGSAINDVLDTPITGALYFVGQYSLTGKSKNGKTRFITEF